MYKARPLRILLVDDHALFRSGVKAELAANPDLIVVGEACDGFQALAKTQEILPDVVLLDLSMPRCSGLAALDLIKEQMPQVRVIVLTEHDDDEHLFGAIRRGADGYLLKDLEPSELLDMLDKVGQGEAVLSGGLAGRILNGYRKPQLRGASGAASIDSLSDRETEVLKLVVRGHSNPEIGQALVITESTVKMHLRNILEKLHLENRTQAAVHAVRQGLVASPPHGTAAWLTEDYDNQG